MLLVTHKPTMNTYNSKVTDWPYFKQIKKDEDTSHESWKGTDREKRYKRSDYVIYEIIK